MIHDLGRFRSPLLKTIVSAVKKFQKNHQQFDHDALLLQPAEQFVTGGKLFRGSLCLAVVAALTEKAPSTAVFQAAAALELAGSAILAQDDLMDHAELRRGKPALEHQYGVLWPGAVVHQMSRATPAGDFGLSATICVSDVLFFMATKILTQLELSAAVKVALLAVMSDQIAELALNQAEELRVSGLPLTDPTITEALLRKIMIGKTARYTALWPLQYAGILVGADANTQKSFAEYGEAMGLVFQLSDDRLGLFGDAVKTGKDTDSDAKAGKKTLYALLAREQLRGKQRAEFLALYGKANLTRVEHQRILQLLTEGGVTTAVTEIVQREVARAKAAAAGLTRWPQLVALLTAVVEFLEHRDH